MPVAADAAPLDASSLWIAVRGVGTGFTPPDANGDSFISIFEGGNISGAFNGPMLFRFDFVLHTRTGIVKGTGTASCDPCTVTGLIGSVSFTFTASGHGSLLGGLTVDGGTWNISGATGALVGITGAGHWTEAFHKRFLTGSILLSAGCDSTGNGNGSDECKQ